MIRFNKGCLTNLRYPLTKIPPFHEDSRLVDPMIGVSHGLKCPTMPEDECFEAELFEVEKVRDLVTRHKWPADFLAAHHPRFDFDPMRIPEPLELYPASIINTDPVRAAYTVRMDSPIDMPLLVIEWLNRIGVPLDRPWSKHINFIQRNVKVLKSITDKQTRDIIDCFEAKYFFGRPRPEEVHPLGAGIAQYSEGCPCHPAYPAGHGALAAAVGVLTRTYDLGPWHKKEIFDTAYHWAMYRTFAGVHYASDNLAGLAVGGFDYWNLKA